MFKPNHKGQSIVEYAILLGVVIAALLIMQFFVKRGIQGGLKDSADKMGEQFSAGGTAISQKRTMKEDTIIKDESATTAKIDSFLPAGSESSRQTLNSEVLTYSGRTGGDQVATTQTKTDSASVEKTRIGDFQAEEVTNFPEPTPQ